MNIVTPLRRTVQKYNANPGIRVKIQLRADLYLLQKEIEDFRQEFLRSLQHGVEIDFMLFQNISNQFDECLAHIRWRMHYMQVDIDSSITLVQAVTEGFLVIDNQLNVKMELHKRLMKVAGTEFSIFKIIENSPALQESSDSVIGKYLEDCFGKLKSSNICENDLELLRLLLCQLYKFHFECFKNDRVIKLSIEFNQLVEFLINSDLCKDKRNQSILYDIIVLHLVLLVDQKNFVRIFEDFQSNCTTTLFQDGNNFSIDTYLKLLNCFLSTWEILNFLHEKKDFGAVNKAHLESCEKVLLSSVLYDVQTMVKQDENTEWPAVQSVLSKIVSIAQRTKILSPYIDEILENDVTLETVCALSDFIFPMDTLSSDLDYCLIHNRNLLKMIQDNLHIECPQKRKQALYLLKKLVEFIDLNEEALRGLNMESCLQLIPCAINPFMCNNTQSNVLPIKQVRKNFILVLEALEEKQKHLVAPCLPLVETLIDAVTQHKSCGNCFDIDWLYCVFARILAHYNSAIVKWGVLRLIKLPMAYTSDTAPDYLMLIVNTLNNTFLYEKNCDQSESMLTNALTVWFKDLQTNWNSVQLVENFLYCCGQVQWGPVPFFYVLQSLFYASLEFDTDLQWEEEPLLTMKALVSKNIMLHPPMLRSMSHIQLIQILCNTANINDLKNLINFMSVFPEEDLKQPSTLSALRLCLVKMEYSKVAIFVKSICNSLKADDQQVIISMPIFSLVIQLLYEGGIICQTDQCSITKELKALLLCLDKIDVRPYIKLSLITKIIDFINGFFSWECQPPDCIKLIFSSYKGTVFNFILKLMHNEAFAYKDIEIYDKTLRNTFNVSDVAVNSKELEIKCIQVLDDAAQHSPPQILFALKSWSNISCNYKYEDKLFLQKVKNILAVGKSQKPSNEITGIAGLDFYTSVSKLIKNHVPALSLEDLKANDEWLEISSFILDVAGNQVLIYLSDVVKNYSTVVTEDAKKLENFKLLIKSFWSCNFGSKRERAFWLVAQKLTECINSSEFLQNQYLHSVSKEFIDRMLKEGESLLGLKYILLTCSDVNRNFNHFTEALLDGLLHGQVLRRDQRISMQASITGKEIFGRCELKDDKLKKFKAHDFLNRQCNVDVAVRTAAVIQLCKALDENKENANILLPLVLQKLSTVQNKRYFADSQLHRLKHRLMQTLLLLQPYLNKESTQILYHALRDSILRDTDQHSVRLMKEWLLTRIYISNQNFLSDLWLFFDRVYDERPNSAGSLIGIIWHIVQQSSNKSREKIISTALPKLGICCMGQQFSMRLFGQIFFVKIYEMLGEDCSVRKEYASLYNATLASLSCGNFKKNPVKIDEDFFYTVFKPELYYSLETIYHQLPRLSNVSFEEFITRENFEEHIFATKSVINMRVDNCDKFLDEAIIPYSILKSSDNSKPEEIESSDISNDVQKKITPWRTVLPNEDELAQMTSTSALQPKTKHTKDIIVVASLVDKPQNLGGIARTCEIFGVKELVISNLKQIEDKEFQALSVSADKWIKMTEAKVFLLSKYLTELKNSGWTLVGAEQTANSVNLVDYKFPKQTVLILGNEKNGIPANIIPLLDVCVEVPQYGIIRSLNVHVTSAICIWEYSKQHQPVP